MPIIKVINGKTLTNVFLGKDRKINQIEGKHYVRNGSLFYKDNHNITIQMKFKLLMINPDQKQAFIESHRGNQYQLVLTEGRSPTFLVE